MDFNEAFGATDREVLQGNREGRATRIVRASRIYGASQSELWSASTEQSRVACWFAEVSGVFELGGRYAIKGNADGTIIVCEPPRSFGLTWEFGGTISWVTVTTSEVDDGVQLTLQHEMAIDEESEAHWATYGPGATGVGWEMAILGLEVYLAGDGASALEAGATWAESNEAKATFRTWAEAWGDAHVRAGESIESARGMAERTAQFYTGEC